jgi:hypothetical protein
MKADPMIRLLFFEADFEKKPADANTKELNVYFFHLGYICALIKKSSSNDNRSVERLEGSCERLEEVSLTTIVRL